MKAITPKTKPMIDAGGVSATDIIMNLFIFFMIVFTLLATFEEKKAEAEAEGDPEYSLGVKLPTSSSEAVVTGEAIAVVLMKDGTLTVEGAATRPDEFERTLAKILAGRQNESLVLRADKDVPLGTVVAYMDRARTAGAQKLSIATTSDDSPP